MNTTIAGAVAQATEHVRNKSILAQVRSGVPLYEAAAEAGISTIEASERMEAELLREKKLAEYALKKKILALYEENVPVQEISKQVNKPLSDVNKVINRFTGKSKKLLNTRPAEKYAEINPDKDSSLTAPQKKERNDAVAASFMSGNSISGIAETFFLKPGMVYYILRSRGVPVKKIRNASASNMSYSKKPYKYDKEFRAEAAALYAETGNVREAAKAMNISYVTMYSVLKKEGVVFHNTSCLKDKDFISKAAKLYIEMGTVKAVATEMNVSYSTIYTALQSEGVVCNNTSCLKDKDFINKVAKLYAELGTIKAVAAEMNVSYSTVYAALRNGEIDLNRSPRFKYDEDFAGKVVAAFKSGKKARELSKDFNAPLQAIYKMLKENGIIFPDHSERHKLMLELYKEGKPVKEIAEIFNMQRVSVWNVLYSHGMFPKRRAELVKERNEKIYKLFREGKTTRELADEFNLTKRGVRDILGGGEMFLDKALLETVNALDLENIPPAEIAKRTGLCLTGVNELLQADEEKINMLNERADLFREMYEKNCPVPEIAEKMNVIPLFVFMWLVKLKFLSHADAYSLKQKTVKDLLNAGHSAAELSHLYSLPLKIVNYIAKSEKNHMELTDEIVERAKAGCSSPKLAEEYGLSRDTLRQYLKMRGLSFEEISRKKVWARYEAIAEEFKTGASPENISRRYKTKCTVIHRILRKQNISAFEQRKKKMAQREEVIVEKLKNGRSPEQVAAELNVSIGLINRRKSKAGIARWDLIKKRDGEITALFMKGMPISGLMKKFGLTEFTTRNALYRNGIKPENEQYRMKREKMYADYISGKSIREIMDMYNLKNITVRNIINAMKPVKFTEQREREYADIGERYKSGQTAEEISTHYNFSMQRVRAILCRQGIKKPLLEKRRANRDEVVRLCKEESLTAAEISEKTGFAIATVQTILNNAGLSARENFYKKQCEEAAALYKSGKSPEELMEYFKKGRSAVREMLKCSGIHHEDIQLAKREQEAVKLARKGIPLTAIANRINVSECTVMKYLRKHNTSCEKEQLRIRNNKIARHWKSGKTIKELKSIFHLSEKSLRTALKAVLQKPMLS